MNFNYLFVGVLFYMDLLLYLYCYFLILRIQLRSFAIFLRDCVRLWGSLLLILWWMIGLLVILNFRRTGILLNHLFYDLLWRQMLGLVFWFVLLIVDQGDILPFNHINLGLPSDLIYWNRSRIFNGGKDVNYSIFDDERIWIILF